MNEKELVTAWIRYHQRSKPKKNDPDFESAERLNDLTYTQPERAFDLVVLIIAQTGNKKILSNVGAGPLENLLASHGEQFVEKVLDNARQDANWRFALSCVWIDGTKDTATKNKVQDAIKLYFPNGTP